MSLAQYKMQSPIGPLYLVASPKGLQGIYWQRKPVSLFAHLEGDTPAESVLREAARQLGEYFDGKRRRFSVALDLTGTAFQRRVWKELSKIPFGKTCSYSDVARRIKNPKAVRAVGSANGKNPVCILIPCHRVVAADGTIGGYAGGINIKKQLLKLEGK